MNMRNNGIHIDRNVLEQIPDLRVTMGLLSMTNFRSSPTRESASAFIFRPEQAVNAYFLSFM